ncbi:hypothetical protein HK098_006393 [Nowakowskiella sp. JEL0407]|nr:hypothetical protein HK098_006393 [Nowakowskiella sp. JEL0407]
MSFNSPNPRSLLSSLKQQFPLNFLSPKTSSSSSASDDIPTSSNSFDSVPARTTNAPSSPQFTAPSTPTPPPTQSPATSQLANFLAKKGETPLSIDDIRHSVELLKQAADPVLKNDDSLFSFSKPPPQDTLLPSASTESLFTPVGGFNFKNTNSLFAPINLPNSKLPIPRRKGFTTSIRPPPPLKRKLTDPNALWGSPVPPTPQKPSTPVATESSAKKSKIDQDSGIPDTPNLFRFDRPVPQIVAEDSFNSVGLRTPDPVLRIGRTPRKTEVSKTILNVLEQVEPPKITEPKISLPNPYASNSSSKPTLPSTTDLSKSVKERVAKITAKRTKINLAVPQPNPKPLPFIQQPETQPTPQKSKVETKPEAPPTPRFGEMKKPEAEPNMMQIDSVKLTPTKPTLSNNTFSKEQLPSLSFFKPAANAKKIEETTIVEEKMDVVEEIKDSVVVEVTTKSVDVEMIEEDVSQKDVSVVSSASIFGKVSGTPIVEKVETKPPSVFTIPNKNVVMENVDVEKSNTVNASEIYEKVLQSNDEPAYSFIKPSTDKSSLGILSHPEFLKVGRTVSDTEITYDFNEKDTQKSKTDFSSASFKTGGFGGFKPVNGTPSSNATTTTTSPFSKPPLPASTASNIYGFPAFSVSSAPVSDSKKSEFPAPATNNTFTTTAPAKSIWGAPIAGWECPSCLVNNKDDATRCVSCETENPKAKSTKPTTTTSNVWGAPVGGWECPSCLVKNKDDATRCVSCETENPKAKSANPTTNTPTAPQTSIWGIKPKTGWKCSECLITNKEEATQCESCESPKPKDTSLPATTTTAPPPTTLQRSSTSSGFENVWGKPSGWKCNECFTQNKVDATKCAACEADHPTRKPSLEKSASVPIGGFKFGTVSTSSDTSVLFGGSGTTSSTDVKAMFGTPSAFGTTTTNSLFNGPPKFGAFPVPPTPKNSMVQEEEEVVEVAKFGGLFHAPPTPKNSMVQEEEVVEEVQVSTKSIFSKEKASSASSIFQTPNLKTSKILESVINDETKYEEEDEMDEDVKVDSSQGLKPSMLAGSIFGKQVIGSNSTAAVPNFSGVTFGSAATPARIEGKFKGVGNGFGTSSNGGFSFLDAAKVEKKKDENGGK